MKCIFKKIRRNRKYTSYYLYCRFFTVKLLEDYNESII